MPYVPLRVKSNFSFLEGASHPAELVERAHALGLEALALTDRDGVYGIVQAHVTARELGLKLLIGAEITVGDVARPAETLKRGETRRVVLLAEDRAGYGSLCRLISAGRGRCEKGSSLVSPEEVNAAARGLLALAPDPALMPGLADAYRGRLFAPIARHLSFEEDPKERKLRAVARRLGVPTVAANEIL